MHSVTTLLGRTVHQLVNANIWSANHVATSKCTKACRHGQEVQLLFGPNLKIGKKCDPSDFDRGRFADARQGGFSISETADLDVLHTKVSRVCREWCGEKKKKKKKKKHQKKQQFQRQKRVVNERGQRRRARLVRAERKETVMQISTHFNSGMQKGISEHRTGQTSKWIVYSSRRPIRLKGSLIYA